MKKIITFNQAVLAIMLILALIVLFHLAILIGILLLDFAPINYLWGGRLETRDELLRFEIISFFTSSSFLLFVLIRSAYVPIPRLMGIAKVVMWLMFILFVLNTIGNLMAESNFEKFFTIITGLLAILSLRIALEKSTESADEQSSLDRDNL